jgi:hypothetical protein
MTYDSAATRAWQRGHAHGVATLGWPLDGGLALVGQSSFWLCAPR